MTKISTTLDWIVLIFCEYIKYLADELRRKSKANMNESEILLDIENFHPPGGFRHYKNIDIINARCPGMAGTTPGRADPNREIKAGTNIIHCPAEKRKDKI